MNPVRFDEAWSLARAWVEANLAPAHPILVRDLYGRIRLAVDDEAGYPLPSPEALKELHAALGAFSAGAESLLLVKSEMLAPDMIFESPDLVRGENVSLLERGIVGADWGRPRLGVGSATRIALYGVKGGVGRSTAGAVLAHELSRRGLGVLVLDLDLESPGIGTTMLPADRLPDYGLVDWFVEDAVGQADDELLDAMVAVSPLEADGHLWVAPAGGRLRSGYEYLSKLARAYVGVTRSSGAVDFATRLSDLADRLEARLQPDVVLLDSRAGLHDIAAIAVTRLGAYSLLFAVDSPQTWQAYRILFEFWRQHYGAFREVRSNLRMVAAMVPETESQSYVESFQQNSYELFADTVYEQAGEFNFDLTSQEAPHNPLRINWMRALQQYDPVNRPQAVTPDQVQAAMGAFVESVASVCYPS
ncbi:MAG: P-loop NTPase [Candidatus Eremiobacterota bacterium]